MMFLFDLPLILSGPLVIGGLVLVGNLGLRWFRRHRHPRLKFGEGDGDFLAAVLASIMVFYGLATALIAVHVFEVHQRVKEITKHEASSLAVLYRNVSEYPEPAGTELRAHLRAYTYQIIHSAWPLLRRGRIPVEGVMYMDRFQSTLMKFEPTTEAQKGLALTTLTAYNEMMQVRRLRIDSVDRALPGVMWLVIVLGALISLISAFYFPVHDSHVHHVQVSLLAAFIGLVIFLVMALDRPFHGDLGVQPHAYEIIYRQLMEH